MRRERKEERNPMRVNRRFLYWGLVLVAIGGVLVASDLGVVNTATLADVLRLWPLAIVAVGLSIVLRRTGLSVAALVVAALLPGLVLGSAFAIVPRFAGDCAARGVPQNVASAEGSFAGPATVSVRSGCGTLTIGTAAGNDWRLDARSTTLAGAPAVESTDRSLSIDGPGDGQWNLLDAGRADWDVTLPTNDLDDVEIAVLAGSGQVDLPGAEIDRLALTANAARMTVDASEATVAELSVAVNVGSLAIQLPATDLDGTLRVGAGELQICAPPELGLRITSRGTAEHVSVNGLDLASSEGFRFTIRGTDDRLVVPDDGDGDSEWHSLNYESATHHADLRISANFGAVEIDPIGGCS